jgi:hypothetical protein
MDVARSKLPSGRSQRGEVGAPDQFKQAVRKIAEERERRDQEQGLGTDDNLLPGQRRWQDVHRQSRVFDTETRALIERVVDAANAEIKAHGFLLQQKRTLRKLPGEINGIAFIVASAAGLEPTGTLNFKLRDTGRVWIEAEGIASEISFDGTQHARLDFPLAMIQRQHVEAAVLSFLGSVLGGSENAYSE